MKKVINCGLSTKLRHESKKVYKQNVYQVKFYVFSPKFNKIGPQTIKFKTRITPETQKCGYATIAAVLWF